MSTAKKSTTPQPKAKSLVRTDYLSRNAPINFFTDKRKIPFAPQQIKPSSAYKTQASRRQSLATTQPYSFNHVRSSIQPTSRHTFTGSDDERVNGLVEFFGSTKVALPKGQLPFALYTLRYVGSPMLPLLSERDHQLTEVVFDQLKDRLTNCVPLDQLIKFIETIERLKGLGIKLERVSESKPAQIPESNNFRSPFKENKGCLVNSDITFHNLQTKEPNRDFGLNSATAIGRFSFGSENFNALNKPGMSTSKSLEKKMLFTATVDLHGCKKTLKVFKGDSVQLVAKKFADANQLSGKQYDKLYQCLMKRINAASNGA